MQVLPPPPPPPPPIGGFTGAAGVIELLVLDAILVPIAFVAVTVNVYEVPFVKPVTVIGELLPVPVCPSFEVTV